MNLKKEYLKKANQFLSEQPVSFPKERIYKITDAAMNAFFQKVNEMIPETKDQDKPGSVQARGSGIVREMVKAGKDFEELARIAVETWVNYYTDEEPIM